MSSRLDPVRASVAAALKTTLEDYLKHTQFQFANPAHVDALRKNMELVYLRQAPLVAIDVEAYERSPSKITEVGVAIYDPEGQWLSAFPRIQSFHVVSKENKRLYNSRWVPNNKHRFNGGVSYELAAAESQQFLSKLLTRYFSRGAVLVGHNVRGDVRWLERHGVHSAARVPTVDTQLLHQMSRRRGATLRGLLRTVGLLHANLHNGGNDAYYTLLAAMCYCDPAQRQHFGLDVFEDNQAKLSPAQARKHKFSDESVLLAANELPSFELEEALPQFEREEAEEILSEEALEKENGGEEKKGERKRSFEKSEIIELD